MNWMMRWMSGANRPAEDDGRFGEDAELQEALKDFKSSVHAWSEAAYNRPRTLAQQVKRRSWRLALGWAMGCMLVAGSASGLLHERHQRQEVARIAAAQHEAEQQQQKQLLEQEARVKVSDEVLLAGVDSDISRQVPSAMEPLGQLMDETK
jgi:hypothetical protein